MKSDFQKNDFSERKDYSFFDNIQDAIFQSDENHLLRFMNKAGVEMFGYASMDEMIGLSLADLWAFPDEREKYLEKIKKSKSVNNYEALMKKRDGTQFWIIGNVHYLVNKKGMIMGLEGSVRDISLRKQLEDQLKEYADSLEEIVKTRTKDLKESEEKYRKLTENSLSGVYIIQNGKLQFLNKRILEISGYTEQSLLGKDVLEFIYADDKEKARQITGKQLAGEGVQPSHELRIVRQNGEIIWVEIRHSLIDYKSKPALLGNINDITKKKLLGQERLKAHLSLEKAHNKLKTLFETSQQVTSKPTITHIINQIHKTVREIVPDSAICLIVLNSSKKDLISFADMKVEVSVKDDFKNIVHKLNKPWLVNWILTSAGDRKLYGFNTDHSPSVLVRAMKAFPIWYAFPISTEIEPIGCLFLAPKKDNLLQQIDSNFIFTFISQVAGCMRQAVLYEEQIIFLKNHLSGRNGFCNIIGKNKQMVQIYNLIEDVAPSSTSVLITGENGTGKELVAKAIHKLSPRKDKPFIVVNCASYSANLLESELFGHEANAFTGAAKRKLGRFEIANGGIVFLDEIGEISQSAQVLLLRFLQDHKFERVGGNETIKTDVRVIAATNKDLLKEIGNGQFREDLYYRLNVISVHLPPLRERKDDIPILSEYFLNKINLIENKHINGFEQEVISFFMDYEWPGNVRELENTIARGVILAKENLIECNCLPVSRREVKAPADEKFGTLADQERQLILAVLDSCAWNKHKTARILNISRATLYSKIRRYKLK
ncbi:MAG: sigma 54-interacting transcriptional regulator [Deltaproteobacteria bacterium]|nr:sigma 54-interacting transcriptional regulator [Deltaproteobacteria bacterium]